MATCPAGKQKGINTVEWYFNRQAPKVAKGKTIAGAAGTPPTVIAGKYTVKISKGNEVFEKQIDVLYDPKSPFTLAERTEQQQITNELFDMTQDLAYFVFIIDSWDASVADYQVKNAGKNKAAEALNLELDALRDNLVVTKGDNYVGAGEPQLREKLGDIYSTIASYFGAPSSSQIENINLLKKRFSDAKVAFDKLKTNQIKAFEKELVKKSIAPPVIVSFEEFLKLD
jgi:RecA/RadA recombinase